MPKIEGWLEENWKRLMRVGYTWKDMRKEICDFVNENYKFKGE